MVGLAGSKFCLICADMFNNDDVFADGSENKHQGLPRDLRLVDLIAMATQKGMLADDNFIDLHLYAANEKDSNRDASRGNNDGDNNGDDNENGDEDANGGGSTDQ